jgi:uncharacterized protein Veg
MFPNFASRTKETVNNFIADRNQKTINGSTLFQSKYNNIFILSANVLINTSRIKIGGEEDLGQKCRRTMGTNVVLSKSTKGKKRCARRLRTLSMTYRNLFLFTMCRCTQKDLQPGAPRQTMLISK